MSVIRGTALTGYHQLVTDLGGDSRALLSAAHIPPADAGRHDRFISLPNGIAALAQTAATVGAPDFGRQLARRQDIAILGPVGLAARSAATVADAFGVFGTFMADYSPAITTRLTTTAADPALRRFEFEYHLGPGAPQAQAIELSLGVTLRILHLLLGGGYRPVSVHLPHGALTPPRDYKRYFGCPAHFCEPVAGFTLRAADLLQALPRDALAHQTAMSYLTGAVAGHTPPTSRLVHRLIRQFLASGAVTIDDIAGHAGMHPKTLQRRLRAENTSFAVLLDGTRRDTAERLLRETDLSLGHICRELGYAEQSVLTQASRRWFGTTPSNYRKAGVAAPEDR